MNIDALRRRRAETAAQIAAREQYMKRLDERDAPQTQPGAALREMRNPQRYQLAQDMKRLQEEVADAIDLQRMTVHHPRVAGLIEKLERLRARYDDLPETVTVEQPPALSPQDSGALLVTERGRVEMEVHSLAEVIAQLDGEIAETESRKAALEKDKTTVFERHQAFLQNQQALRAARSDLGIWRRYVEVLSRARAAEESERGIQFSTLVPAGLPAKPFSPTLKGVFLFSFAVALLLGAGSVFLREVLDHAVHEPARIRESLGIPVLETIESFAAPTVAGFARRVVMSGVVAVQALLVLAAAFIVYARLEQPQLFARIADWGPGFLTG